MKTTAVLLDAPRSLGLAELALTEPKENDIVIEIDRSGISTGTEKLFWTGDMPPFPGSGYPLVPGYEATGEVVEAPRHVSLRPGQRVFVPGAACYEGAHGLFGGSARRIVTDAARVTPVDAALGAEGALLALAATARHAIAGQGNRMPELIIGHGVLGRLLARLTIAAGSPPPVVWDIDPARQAGAEGYDVIHPDTDERRDYGCIFDASGRSDLLDTWIGRLARGGEVVLAGFYAAPLQFAFPPAFMREARLRIAAEWQPADMTATRALVESGALSLAGLITHTRPAAEAAEAYETAFSDPACLKMILDWSQVA
ncbi:MAG: 3-hydroxyethyl bacteriochlorophyllide a dehydrogenase BchC [Rhodobacteraceae bacterium HLUCCA08]|nr:MAG: 3-hydroxyethyl bacteriochlorophyllide a dehydrogenase BchC [Rhodobacteraceae bacterium HLUCCA08]